MPQPDANGCPSTSRSLEIKVELVLKSKLVPRPNISTKTGSSQSTAKKSTEKQTPPTNVAASGQQTKPKSVQGKSGQSTDGKPIEKRSTPTLVTASTDGKPTEKRSSPTPVTASSDAKKVQGCNSAPATSTSIEKAKSDDTPKKSG